jgi:predicted transcriptional regulator
MSEDIHNELSESRKDSLKQRAIKLRRQQVLELHARGYSQQKIADRVHCDQSLVSLDLQYLRELRNAKLEHHFNEIIPEDYEICKSGLTQIIERCWDLQEDTIVIREKAMLMQIAKDCYRALAELSGDSSIVKEALAVYKRKLDRLKEKREEEKRQERELLQQDIEEYEQKQKEKQKQGRQTQEEQPISNLADNPEVLNT